MAEQTLLEIVHRILIDMKSDTVNSIFDTEEAEEVAHHVRATYQALMSNSKWDHTRRLVGFISYSNHKLPTHMYLPDYVKALVGINYNTSANTKRNYVSVKYLEPDAFLMKLNKRDSDKDTIQIVVDPSGVELLIASNKNPEYYTSFDDRTVVFDSFNSDVEDVLQKDKIQAWAYIMPEFTIADSFVPDLPTDMFSLLIEEATSRCQFKIREVQDGKSEQEAGRQRRWASRESWRTKESSIYPDYGRKR